MTARPGKTTGLAAFTGGHKPAPVESTQPVARKRAKGELVALTIRIRREDWVRLHQLALSEGTSLQALAVAGLSKVMAEHGLPAIAS